MKKSGFIIILMILGTMFPVRGEVMTLEQCVDSALVYSPSVAVAALEIERARVMKGTAFNPPMTEITLKQETTGGGGPENGVYFGQQFDFPTLYVARHRSLQAQGDLAASRFDLLVRDIRKEVAAAYCSLQYSKELLRLNSELGTVYDEFCRLAEVRLKEGETSPLELLNARRVSEKNAMERQQEQQNYRQWQLELQRLTGCEGVEADNWDTELIVAEESSFDFASTARGTVALKEIAVAEREYSVVKNELLPEIRIGATVQALIKSFNPYNVERLPFGKGNFMGFEVGISVPLFFGAQASRIKAADVDRKISLLNLETVENQVMSERTKLQSEIASEATRLKYYRETALPQAEEIRRIATVSYELGDIDYMEYISNLETAYTIYREYASSLNAYRQSMILLEALNY